MRIGNRAINSTYVGNRAINLVYRGQSLIWPLATNPLLFASASISNSDSASLFFAGNNTITIQWDNNTTQSFSLQSNLTKYSQSYSASLPQITIAGLGNITSAITCLTSNYVIPISSINSMTSLTSFTNIDSLISGSVENLNISNLDSLNFGNQESSSVLTGNVGILIDNHLFTNLNLRGGDVTYTTQSFTGIPNSASYAFEDNNFTNQEVDNIIFDMSGSGAQSGSLSIIGSGNGFRTTESNTAYSDLITLGWDVNLNGEPLTALTYSNLAQTFISGTAITNLTPTLTPASASASAFYEIWGSPTGLSIDSSTGVVSGTPNDVTESYETVIRATAFNDYTGHQDFKFTIDLTGSIAGTLYLINFTTNGTITGSQHNDPSGRYWNNMLSGVGSLTNIVDSENNATAIDLNVTQSFSGAGANGRTPNDGVYPDNVWQSYLFMSSGTGSIALTSLDNAATYDITIGASRDTSATDRIGGYTPDGGTSTNTLDAALNPPQTIKFTNISPTSGIIIIDVWLDGASSFSYINFIEVEEFT